VSAQKIVWFHRGRAIAWILLAVPAIWWWADSILLAILLSLYANAVSDWGAAEAADDSRLLARVEHVEQKIDDLIAELRKTP
jgi:hypothetical protein